MSEVEDVLVRKASLVLAELYGIKDYYLIYRYVARTPDGIMEFDGVMVSEGTIIGIEAKHYRRRSLDKLIKQCVVRRDYFNYMYGVTDRVTLFRLVRNIPDLIIYDIGLIEYNLKEDRYRIIKYSARREVEFNILEPKYVVSVGKWEHIELE